ncbi:retrovirus-related pol polyprotein from transposon TNT 1-94 [Tanacetum coccineum]
MPKTFGECKYYGSNKHHPDDCEFYPGCEICGSIAHEIADCPKNLRNNRKQRDYLTRSVWYLDSGCSRHMIGVKQYLHKYSKESGPKVVFGDDSSGDTEGYGSVNCNRITFTRVAYVNGLKHNLISISQLCDANFKVLFTKTQGTIFNQNDKVVLIAPRRRDVYVIDISFFNKDCNACFFAKASPSVNWLWHKRLSHLNFKNINNLAKHNLISGIPSLNFSKDKNYLACEKGKHHRALFKTKRSFSISKSLHLLHMDLFRPKKSDAADCIISFIRKMENINEVRVKELRSDNGTEFKNHKLEEFYDEKGISQNFSSPCTIEQNGVAERRNRTLIEAAKTISIIVKRHGKTTYDVVRGRSPDISYFHVFGCPVHIHNHRDHLGKFDEKANDGFFLGYSPVDKAFRVFNIRRQELEETIYVTFSEDDEAISQTSTEGDAINFNENRSFPDDKFIKPKSKDTQCSVNIEYFSYVSAYENITSAVLPTLQNSVTSEESPEFTIVNDLLAIYEHDHAESTDILESAEPQDNVLNRWSREKHIELVNIIGEPLAGITTRSRVKDSDAASAHKCLYVNFLSKIEPKKLIEALEEEGWVIAIQEELNQFERNKMDMKSAFLNGKISEEVYVQQPPVFESSEFPDHVYKLDKALYRLKQAPRAWYQANRKESHLVAVKRIFRKCISGGCHILGGKLVCWSAKKQSSVAMSSVEADAIVISNNLVLHSRTKHIDIRYHFIRDHILKGDIELHFVPTELQLADIFTKPLAKPSFTRLVAELGNLNHFTALTKEPSSMYIEYLKDLWYTTEVDDATKDISFSLSLFENQLLFTRFDFLGAIGLTDSKTIVPLPPKGTVRAGLATLGLANKDKPSLTSTKLGSHDQMNLSQQTIAYCLIFGLEINIEDIIFKDLINKLQNGKKNRETNICYTRYISLTPSASEVSLTSHMLKVAKLSKEPEEPLILPSKEVNAEESADKSQSGTNVQPLSQPKAPTAKKYKKKKIISLTQLKVSNVSIEMNPSSTTTHLQATEEFVVTAVPLQSLATSITAEKIVETKEVAEELTLEIPTIEQLLDEVDNHNKAIQATSESPYDTESEIKVVKSFLTSHLSELQDQTMNDYEFSADI